MTVTFRVCQACGHGQFVGVDVQSYRCQLCGNSNPANKEAFEPMSDPASASIAALIPGSSQRNDNPTSTNRQAVKSDTLDKMEECEKKSVSKAGNSQIAEPWPPAETAETTTEPFECDLTSMISYFDSEYRSKDYDVLRRNLLDYLLAIHTVFSADKFELLLLSGKKIERKKRMGILKYDYATIKDSWNQTHTFLGKALSNEQFAKEVLRYTGIEEIGTIEGLRKKTISPHTLHADADKETEFQLLCTFSIDNSAPAVIEYHKAYTYSDDIANHSEIKKLLLGLDRYNMSTRYFSSDGIVDKATDYGQTVFYRVPDNRESLTASEMLAVLAVVEHRTDWYASLVRPCFNRETPFYIELEKKMPAKPQKNLFSQTKSTPYSKDIHMSVAKYICSNCGHTQFVGDSVQSYHCQLCGFENQSSSELEPEITDSLTDSTEKQAGDEPLHGKQYSIRP